jgi:hypothetical protein
VSYRANQAEPLRVHRHPWRRRVAWLALAAALRAGAGAAETPAPPPPRSITVGSETALDVGFEHLASFPYVVTDAGTGATPAQIEGARRRDQVPPVVRALDGKRVTLSGYMLPLQMEKGRAKKFVLMRDVSTCCFGATPNMNDYVVVTMKGEGVPAVPDIPTAFLGVLHIGERYEGGYLVSLYDFDAEKSLGPRK